MDTIGGETDLFAEGKIAMVGTDFTEVDKYKANGIDFGIVPFYAVEGPEPVLDTFTAPWGTFTESGNPEAALAFLRFLATDAQVMRMQLTPDPPLRTSIAETFRYGDGDPVKEEYLALLNFARPAVFIPNGVEAWDPGEVVRRMTVERQTDARPILDAMVAETQPELDAVWQEWERLGP
jgi:Bacterial extracellular solute-binding protein